MSTEQENQNWTIQVDNLPKQTMAQELVEAFEKFGAIVKSRIEAVSYRGQLVSRGFGFVDFATKDGYLAALENEEPIILSDSEGERTVIVSPANSHPKDKIFLSFLDEKTSEEDNQQEKENMTIHVGNLPYKTSGKELAEAFEKFGPIVQSRIISMMYRGQLVSRGSGYIDFATTDGFKAAIENKEPIILSNNHVERTVIVSPAMKVSHRKDTIYLGKLDEKTTKEDIIKAFEGYNITEVRMPQARRPDQENRFFAFVKFDTEATCEKATTLGTINILGRDIRLFKDNQQEKENVTIQVDNLPKQTMAQELAEAFEKFGVIVQSRIRPASYRGGLVSCGFVEFATEDGYLAALENEEPIILSDSEGERTVIVSPANSHPKDKIFLSFLDEKTTEEDIIKAFEGYNITEVRMQQARRLDQENRFFAFVKFDTEATCEKATTLGTINILGKDIKVSLGRPRRPIRVGFHGGRGGFHGGRGGRGRGGFRGGRGRGGFRGRAGRHDTCAPRQPYNNGAQPNDDNDFDDDELIKEPNTENDEEEGEA